MTGKVEKLKCIISNLAQLIETERRAIAERTFEKIAGLTKSKIDLLDDFDNIVMSLGEADSLGALVDGISELRKQAEENASQLKTLADSVGKARERLQILREKEFAAGAYQPDGVSIKTSGASTLSAKV